MITPESDIVEKPQKGWIDWIILVVLLLLTVITVLGFFLGFVAAYKTRGDERSLFFHHGSHAWLHILVAFIASPIEFFVAIIDIRRCK